MVVKQCVSVCLMVVKQCVSVCLMVAHTFRWRFLANTNRPSSGCVSTTPTNGSDSKTTQWRYLSTHCLTGSLPWRYLSTHWLTTMAVPEHPLAPCHGGTSAPTGSLRWRYLSTHCPTASAPTTSCSCPQSLIQSVRGLWCLLVSQSAGAGSLDPFAPLFTQPWDKSLMPVTKAAELAMSAARQSLVHDKKLSSPLDALIGTCGIPLDVRL